MTLRATMAMPPSAAWPWRLIPLSACVHMALSLGRSPAEMHLNMPSLEGFRSGGTG
jgi:hypothetical protein